MFWKCWISEVMRYEQILLRMIPSFLVCFEAFLHKNGKGTDLVKRLEVPEIIEKVLKYVRGP